MQHGNDFDKRPIPDRWTWRTVGDLCSILSGGTPSKNNDGYWRGDIPWVSGKDLKAPHLSNTVDHLSEEAVTAGSRIAPRDAVLLLVRGMGLARDLPIAVIRCPMAFNQDVKALVPRTGLSGSFVRHAIYHSRDRLLSRIVPSAHGTLTLNLDDVATFNVPVPVDPTDGNEIGRVLDAVLDAIDQAARQLAASLELKRAATVALFTRGLCGEAQKDTEVGLVPESWRVTTLGATREWLQYGTSTRCVEDEGQYPVLRIPNIEPGRVNASELKYCSLPQAEAQKYTLADGDLLFIRTNGVLERLGSCAVYGGEPKGALFASYLIRARLKRGVDPRYVAYFYGSALGTSLVAGRATPASDGKYNLNTGTIDALPLPLPATIDEQQEIVAILDAIDRKIDLHQRKRAVLDELFKSLLHKLMTGEIAVADLDLSALAPARAEVELETKG